MDDFNDFVNYIAANDLNVDDDFMSAVLFQTTLKGSLPQLSYNFRNNEPLVTDYEMFCHWGIGIIGDKERI